MSHTYQRSLCEQCQHRREIWSAKGSRFILCQLSLRQEKRYAKYPPQPVKACAGFVDDTTQEPPAR